MSMSAGGLAQMTYSNFGQNTGLGVPSSGFASRGKGTHIARLAMPPTSSDIGQSNAATPTPRTSRSHLLANLRTAPKSPGFPPSAPPSQLTHKVGLDGSRYAAPENMNPALMAGPKTSVGSGFPSSQHSLDFSARQVHTSRQMYSMPEQVLAPPSIQIGQGQGEEQMDPSLYAELLATNLYLAQQQQRLQQQLINVTAAAQQFSGLHLNGQMGVPQLQQQQQYYGLYNQQPQQHASLQPNSTHQVITPVMGAQPGLYSVYNPLTGQQGYFIDANASHSQYAQSPPNSSPKINSFAQAQVPLGRARYASPPPGTSMPSSTQRNAPSPAPTGSPAQVSPTLPPPSANAFRRGQGHKKATSSVPPPLNGNATSVYANGPKTAGILATPMSTTFGPGQARAGEHPVRQPRGPPPLEELVLHPTTKHEGSKNFATRQRRRAVHSLVRAGLERRGHRESGSDSNASMTPASEKDNCFSDTDSLGSGSLSGKPSLGSLRAAANGAIGSERRAQQSRSRERDSMGSQFSVRSVSSDEGVQLGAKLAEVKKEENRKTPILVFVSAEKRKSSVF